MVQLASGVTHAGQGLRIAAASSLQFALSEVIDAFERTRQGVNIDAVYGSSGNLYRQIVQGAPFDVFVSADASLIDRLAAAGKIEPEPIVIGRGRLVYFWLDEVDAGSGRVASTRTSVGTLIENTLSVDGARIAIANPRHAPYGVAAKQALQSLSLWQPAQRQLVYGEKVSQAARFIVSGAARAGLISMSLALSPALQSSGNFQTVPEHLHDPVSVSAVIVKHPDTTPLASSPARDWLQFMRTDVSKGVFERYGFE